MILTHLVLFSFLAGASPADAAAPAVAETYSGGHVRAPARSRRETEWAREESASAREARIHAERVRMGILPPDEQKPAALEAADATIEGVPSPLLPSETLDPALAEALAEMVTSAYLDAEITRFFALQDEDDAAVLLLAIATLH